jgi:hypothetical protein
MAGHSPNRFTSTQAKRTQVLPPTVSFPPSANLRPNPEPKVGQAAPSHFHPLETNRVETRGRKAPGGVFPCAISTATPCGSALSPTRITLNPVVVRRQSRLLLVAVERLHSKSWLSNP